jgi:hypothetical protein
VAFVRRNGNGSRHRQLSRPLADRRSSLSFDQNHQIYRIIETNHNWLLQQHRVSFSRHRVKGHTALNQPGL